MTGESSVVKDHRLVLQVTPLSQWEDTLALWGDLLHTESVKFITVRNIFMQAQIAESLNKVQKWVEDHDYKGYEPFDSLSSWLAPTKMEPLC